MSCATVPDDLEMADAALNTWDEAMPTSVVQCDKKNKSDIYIWWNGAEWDEME